MFVKQSTHDKVCEQRDYEKSSAVYWNSKYKALLKQWNTVVSTINEKGGDDFLTHGCIPRKSDNQFTDEELRSLLQLVHPDKHGGKQSAVKLTQKINHLRK